MLSLLLAQPLAQLHSKRRIDFDDPAGKLFAFRCCTEKPHSSVRRVRESSKQGTIAEIVHNGAGGRSTHTDAFGDLSLSHRSMLNYVLQKTRFGKIKTDLCETEIVRPSNGL
jgi:hypothetical protein